jgi:hypothetical protein
MWWVGRYCGRRCGSVLFLGLWAGEQRAKLCNLCKLAARENVGKQVVCGGPEYPMRGECDVVERLAKRRSASRLSAVARSIQCAKNVMSCRAVVAR